MPMWFSTYVTRFTSTSTDSSKRAVCGGFGSRTWRIQPWKWYVHMGAIGLNGIYESEVVLDISLKVADILRSNGVTVQLTRTKKKINQNPYDLEDRLRLAENYKPNFLLSIHANSFTSSTANGVETYWRTSHSKWFATTVHNAYLKQVQLRDRGVNRIPHCLCLKASHILLP